MPSKPKGLAQKQEDAAAPAVTPGPRLITEGCEAVIKTAIEQRNIWALVRLCWDLIKYVDRLHAELEFEREKASWL